MTETFRPIGVVGHPDGADSPFGFSAKGDQRRQDELAREGLVSPEAYREGGLELCLLFDRPARLRAGSTNPPNRHHHIGLSLRKHDLPLAPHHVEGLPEFAHVVRDETKSTRHGHKEFVLVCDIQLMKPIEQMVPATVWPQIFDCSSDVFSGDTYLSLRENIFKALRVPPERELHRFRPFGACPDQAEDGQIQGGSKVVRGVAGDLLVWTEGSSAST
jgi:hypothetical protein